MPKCGDCVHWEVCREYVTRLAAARGVDLDATELEQIFDSDDCDHFHDRSRFVELPCRPDDSLFVIVPDKNGNPSIEEYTVYAVIKKRDRTILETRIGRFIWGKEPCWLSYTEAEQALKEREAT